MKMKKIIAILFLIGVISVLLAQSSGVWVGPGSPNKRAFHYIWTNEPAFYIIECSTNKVNWSTLFCARRQDNVEGTNKVHMVITNPNLKVPVYYRLREISRGSYIGFYTNTLKTNYPYLN